MSNVLHLRCRNCGEKLTNRTEPYCPPCNLYLCYKAMPLILGALLTGGLPIQITQGLSVISPISFYDETLVGYECDEAICWE